MLGLATRYRVTIPVFAPTTKITVAKGGMTELCIPVYHTRVRYIDHLCSEMATDDRSIVRRHN